MWSISDALFLSQVTFVNHIDNMQAIHIQRYTPFHNFYMYICLNIRNHVFAHIHPSWSITNKFRPIVVVSWHKCIILRAMGLIYCMSLPYQTRISVSTFSLICGWLAERELRTDDVNSNNADFSSSSSSSRNIKWRNGFGTCTPFNDNLCQSSWLGKRRSLHNIVYAEMV